MPRRPSICETWNDTPAEFRSGMIPRVPGLPPAIFRAAWRRASRYDPPEPLGNFSGDGMANLIAASLVFLGIHLFISGTRLRDVLVGAMGERPYMGLFSLASLGVIVWMAMAFNQAGAMPGSEADPFLYNLGRGAHDAALPVVAIAFLLGVPGLLTPNPTSV